MKKRLCKGGHLNTLTPPPRGIKNSSFITTGIATKKQINWIPTFVPQCEKYKEINSGPLLLRFGKPTFIVYYNYSKEYKHVH